MEAQDEMVHDTGVRGMPNDWDRSGLPAWTYRSDELLELEKEAVFRRNWLCAGHLSEIPDPGDYLTLEAADERALILRGRDGEVRAFHNHCRHRGSRVVTERQGHCRRAIVCPFHGWSYNLDGSLRAMASPKTFPKIDKTTRGLKTIDFEVWEGLIFVRFKGEGPSVAEAMAPFAGEVRPYRLADLEPLGDYWESECDFNWKVFLDIDNEGYHVPVAHPALQQLYGPGYYDEVSDNEVARSFGALRHDDQAKLWSVRNYLKLLPEADHLPESHRRAWLYYGVFPSTSLELTPDFFSFYQTLPLTSERCRMRGRTYALPDGGREMRAARYLHGRINEQTGREDNHLMALFSEGMRSSAFDGLLLSDLEYGVRAYHDRLRRLMPVLNLEAPPPQGQLAERNRELGGET